MTIDIISKKVECLQRKFKQDDPFRLCADLGIMVSLEPMGTYAGACKGFFLSQSRKRIVTINSDLPKHLHRIIAAHELGHAILHRGSRGVTAFHDFAPFDTTDQKEYEAGGFSRSCRLREGRSRYARRARPRHQRQIGGGIPDQPEGEHAGRHAGICRCGAKAETECMAKTRGVSFSRRAISLWLQGEKKEHQIFPRQQRAGRDRRRRRVGSRRRRGDLWRYERGDLPARGRTHRPEKKKKNIK